MLKTFLKEELEIDGRGSRVVINITGEESRKFVPIKIEQVKRLTVKTLEVFAQSNAVMVTFSKSASSLENFRIDKDYAIESIRAFFNKIGANHTQFIQPWDDELSSSHFSVEVSPQLIQELLDMTNKDKGNVEEISV